jgi:hypothetical protein
MRELMRKTIVACLLTCSLFASAPADDWTVQTVDANGSVGTYSSLELDSDGFPHIAYYDAGQQDLKYARWNGSSWETETVDSGGQVGDYCSLALDSSDNPHITYLDLDYGDLKLAQWTGSSWDIRTVDSTGNCGVFTSVALDADDEIFVSHYDWDANNLKYAHWDGSDWELTTVDDSYLVGQYTDLALDGSGDPHITYFDVSNFAIKYAYLNGTDWEIQTLDPGTRAAYYSSLAIDDSDHPHVALCSIDADLWYANWNGSDWDYAQVDGPASIGGYPSLDLDASGHAHIAHYDAPAADLRYTYWNGSAWEKEVVDQDGSVGTFTSLALDDNGQPNISYYDETNESLKFASTRTDWSSESIELSASPEDDGVLLGWTVSGETPASVRVLRGAENPVAVSDSLPGTTRRWLDRGVTFGESYVYWLEVTEDDGSLRRCGPTEAVVVPEEAQRLALLAPYPSPARDTLTLSYSLPEGCSTANLTIFDLSGRRIVTQLLDAVPGRHSLVLDVAGYQQGVYIARIAGDNASATRRFVISR